MKCLWLFNGSLIKSFKHCLKLSKKGRIFSMKLILFLIILCSGVYLVYSFPDYSILIISIAVILLIGYWLKEAYGLE